jgi:hypothetical protein
MKKNKNDVVVQAIEAMKKGEFGLTGIKIELESQFDRRNSGCENSHTRAGWTECAYCEGENVTTCSNCEGDGEIENDDYIDTIQTPDESEFVECYECEGGGDTSCDECDGGEVECECYDSEDTWGVDTVCHDFILERLVPLGLAEEKGDQEYEYATKYKPKHPLVFSKFYNDGSVDSELTFTLAVDDPSVVLKLPEIVRIFNALGDAIGQGSVTSGAGMHMALLNSAGATYPSTHRDYDRFHNFSRNMSLLMPALFFLGSSNQVSRGLGYRLPQAAEHKYSAVNYSGGALEFRVFETCYHDPEIILDNLVVMKNCMRYWKQKTQQSSLAKIATVIEFGSDYDNTLERFYYKREHLDLLNRGLEMLKPSYYTITDIKQQRKFKKTKTSISVEERQKKIEAMKGYSEYEDRFEWRTKAVYYDYLSNYIQRSEPQEESLEQLKEKARQQQERERARKQSPEQYTQEILNNFYSSRRGRYTLAG